MTVSASLPVIHLLLRYHESLTYWGTESCLLEYKDCVHGFFGTLFPVHPLPEGRRAFKDVCARLRTLKFID